MAASLALRAGAEPGGAVRPQGSVPGQAGREAGPEEEPRPLLLIKRRDRGCPRPGGHGGGAGRRGIAAAVSAGTSRPFSVPRAGMPEAGALGRPQRCRAEGAVRGQPGQGWKGINPDGRCAALRAPLELR